jgi:nitrite reductase (NO-forming)
MKETEVTLAGTLGDEACCGMCGGPDAPAGAPSASRPGAERVTAPTPAAVPAPASAVPAPVELRHGSIPVPLAVRLAPSPLPSWAAPPPRRAAPAEPATPPSPTAAPSRVTAPLALDGRGSDRRSRAARLDRNADRRITLLGLVVAAGFLVVALLAAAGSAGTASGSWSALHLVLAGAAATAITAVMPFFSAALVAAPPARPGVRLTALALVAVGAVLVAGRAVEASSSLPAVGGVLFVAGMAALAWATFAPLRAGLGTSRPLVTAAYAVAIADVTVGASLATLFVAGWLPVVAHWAALKPAHAWLNLLGFVSLVIAGTLLHLLPTVLGGRILPRRSAVVAVGGLAAAAPLVAGGYWLSGGPGPAADLAARAGALAALVGAGALAWHAVAVHRARGRWTTDPGWHRMASLGLEAAIAWFAVAVAIAAVPVLRLGAAPGAWRIDTLLAPLAVGWVTQALVAAWTHLLPAIGPGGPAEHARQRAILGRLATPRLVMLNAGTALLAVGLPGSLAVAGAASALAAAGFAVVAAALVASLVLLATAAMGARAPRPVAVR